MTVAHEAKMYPPPRDMKCPFDPPPQLMEWAKDSPVTRVRQWDGIDAWLITGYREARAVLGDARFSANPRMPGFPEKNPAYAAVLGQDHNIRTMDPPEHTRQKRMVVRDFTSRRVEELRPAIQQNVDGLLDKMAAKGPGVDLYEEFALPLPAMVICDLLGVPIEDQDFFAERSATVTTGAVSAEVAAQAGQELYTYLDDLITRKTGEPGNDLVSRLVHEQLLQGNLERSEIVELARLMLVAGHETTAHMITLSTAALLTHRDQLQDLIDHPDLVVNAVDELLRYLSVTHLGRRRIATVDIEVGGQLISAGEAVIIANNAADRDEKQFSDAYRLDLRRENARTNMAFGYGVHQCIGQLLSRVELQTVHSTLWRRFPTLDLVESLDRLTFGEDASVYSLKPLHVTW